MQIWALLGLFEVPAFLCVIQNPLGDLEPKIQRQILVVLGLVEVSALLWVI